jgi:hypothetical protein
MYVELSTPIGVTVVVPFNGPLLKPQNVFGNTPMFEMLQICAPVDDQARVAGDSI